MKYCIFYQTYQPQTTRGDILFTGTSPGEFDDVKLVKIVIEGQLVKMFDLALEICHHPGTLKHIGKEIFFYLTVQ